MPTGIVGGKVVPPRGGSKPVRRHTHVVVMHCGRYVVLHSDHLPLLGGRVEHECNVQNLDGCGIREIRGADEVTL